MPAEGREQIDVLFPVLHGTYGEDGTIQGLFEMADIPYVGCGVLGSSAGMDKVVMKRLFRRSRPADRRIHAFPPHAVGVGSRADRDAHSAEIGYPCFVKPANLGSSVGISKATDRASLDKAVGIAAQFDRKIIVERGVDARELEVSVLGNDEPQASLPGEIVPQTAEFYDYIAKYVDAGGARLVIPADVSKETTLEATETRDTGISGDRWVGTWASGLFHRASVGQDTSQRDQYHAGLHSDQYVSEAMGGEWS